VVEGFFTEQKIRFHHAYRVFAERFFGQEHLGSDFLLPKNELVGVRRCSARCGFGPLPGGGVFEWRQKGRLAVRGDFLLKVSHD
jgi:hypothetical protein